MNRSKLAITLGDPSGIGPEVILKALADPQIPQLADLTIIGSQKLLEKTYHHLLQQGTSAPLADPAQLSIVDISLDAQTEAQIQVGIETAAGGQTSFQYLESAIAQTLAAKFQGIVTAPISKTAWQAAGHIYPGQTELLAERSQVKRFGMLFVARSPYTNWTLRTLLATTHIPLKAVPETLTPELMTQKLELLVECLNQDFGITTPRIAIAGLNPHSGEQGKLGSEEQTWLYTWLQAARNRWPQVQLDGLIPPDTLWVKPGQAWYGSSLQPHSSTTPPADAYLALYHDQGLIPVKLMAFDCAVNTSIGLPFVRTSPDHGTAFDIAGKGLANPNSMKAAIRLAGELTKRKHTNFS
jgi:4-hydroxythreonine-4-phosphate dehydrogenase